MCIFMYLFTYRKTLANPQRPHTHTLAPKPTAHKRAKILTKQRRAPNEYQPLLPKPPAPHNLPPSPSCLEWNDAQQLKIFKNVECDAVDGAVSFSPLSALLGPPHTPPTHWTSTKTVRMCNFLFSLVWGSSAESLGFRRGSWGGGV